MSSKKGQGLARGHKSTHMLQSHGGQKLAILMPPTVGQPIGEFRFDFMIEIGVVMHDMAPLMVRQWSDITDAQRAPMIDRL